MREEEVCTGLRRIQPAASTASAVLSYDHHRKLSERDHETCVCLQNEAFAAPSRVDDFRKAGTPTFQCRSAGGLPARHSHSTTHPPATGRAVGIVLLVCCCRSLPTLAPCGMEEPDRCSYCCAYSHSGCDCDASSRTRRHSRLRGNLQRTAVTERTRNF